MVFKIMSGKSFLSTTVNELDKIGISRPDVILVSGDAYIDSAYSGVAVIGRVLDSAGYSVAIVAQPDIEGPEDITALGEPRLFWGVSAGCVDSEVANYTALGKPRRRCDFTPGGANTRRPDRACIVYTNLIRRYFKNTAPIVLGGIEASLRRVAHYDQRSDSIRRSVLIDSKADLLVYGMGERQVLEIAARLAEKAGLSDIPGTCIMAAEPPDTYLHLPDYQKVRTDPAAFAAMFKVFYQNSIVPSGRGMVQKYDNRFLLHHPAPALMSRKELDRIFELPYMNDAHPVCRSKGLIKALETIKGSITTHRGCFGECSFCAITVHQGRTVISRSMDSIIREAGRMSRGKDFNGVIKDVGGPTANMYASGCGPMFRGRPCADRHCIGFDGVCPRLVFGHNKQKRLLAELASLPGIKQVNIASGIRYDLVLADTIHGEGYLKQLITRHVPGQMKIAPEHSRDHVLKLMNKPSCSRVFEFSILYRSLAKKHKKNVFLSCYVIAAHPGCTIGDMQRFVRFAGSNLKFIPEQVQIFTPTPSTRSTAMYHAGIDPFTGEKVWTETSVSGKRRQKDAVCGAGGHASRPISKQDRKQMEKPGRKLKPKHENRKCLWKKSS